MSLSRLVLCAAAVAWYSSSPVSAQPADALRFSFDDLDVGEPAEWRGAAEGYRVAVVEVEDGRQGRALEVERVSSDGDQAFGPASRSVSAVPYRARRARLVGWLRTEDAQRNGGQLWLRADGSGAVVAFANLAGRAASGTTDWTRYIVEVDVPETAETLWFGVFLSGDGRLLADDLVLEDAGPAERGEPTELWETVWTLRDAGFEHGTAGERPPGWTTNGQGHVLEVDSAAWSGRGALRVSRTADPSDPELGVARQAFDLPVDRTRRVRISGHVRTDAVEDGYAGLWLRADGGDRAVLALEDMEGRGATGTTSWTRYVAELDVPDGTAHVVGGALKTGSGTAWFDDVVLEAVFGAPIAPPRAAPGPPPAADPADVGWVRGRAVPFDLEGGDLDAVAAALSGRRVVGLGESGHGVAEFNRAKTQIVRALHQDHGVNVLAFEAYMWDCREADRMLDEGRAEEALRTCLFPVWHTAEVLELFEYAASTRDTDRPLRIVGFDAQHPRTSPSRTAFLTWELSVLGLGDEVSRLEGLLADLPFTGSEGAIVQHLEGAGAPLVEGYGRLADRIVSRADSLGVPLGGGQRFALEVVRSLHAAVAAAAAGDRSRVANGDGDGERGQSEHIASYDLRDRQMAENLAYLLDTVHAGEKVVLWAHNAHLSHGPEPGQVTWMGEHVRDRYGDDYYVVGLYAGAGQMASNDRAVYNVARPAGGSLEAVILEAGTSDLFVDLAGESGDWAGRSTTALSWGRYPLSIVPRDEYDAVLLVREVSAPDYLPRRATPKGE